MGEENHSSWLTDSQTPLRDWQKDSWYGPTPVRENPFDEPEDAPELREMRSENLNNRSGAFWQQNAGPQITGGYHFGGRTTQDTATAPAVREPEKRHPLLLTLVCLVAAGILAGVLYYGVFSIRNIQVIGNSQVPASEVIRVSGLRTGMPILSVSAEQVEQKLRQNPVLKFRYLQKDMPGTVVLAVKEREVCCWITWNGIMYTTDKQRMVLYETEDLTIRPANLVRVDGLNIRSGALVGQTLVLDSVEQETIFGNLFLEMKVLGCTELIEEADLSNVSSLLLTTRDGFTVAMGDAQNLHAKLRAMLITREELLSRGYQGGVINVILPETPVYSPAV